MLSVKLMLQLKLNQQYVLVLTLNFEVFQEFYLFFRKFFHCIGNGLHEYK